MNGKIQSDHYLFIGCIFFTSWIMNKNPLFHSNTQLKLPYFSLYFQTFEYFYNFYLLFLAKYQNGIDRCSQPEIRAMCRRFTGWERLSSRRFSPHVKNSFFQSHQLVRMGWIVSKGRHNYVLFVQEVLIQIIL